MTIPACAKCLDIYILYNILRIRCPIFLPSSTNTFQTYTNSGSLVFKGSQTSRVRWGCSSFPSKTELSHYNCFHWEVSFLSILERSFSFSKSKNLHISSIDCLPWCFNTSYFPSTLLSNVVIVSFQSKYTENFRGKGLWDSCSLVPSIRKPVQSSLLRDICS